jgi:hypothetical protein
MTRPSSTAHPGFEQMTADLYQRTKRELWPAECAGDAVRGSRYRLTAHLFAAGIRGSLLGAYGDSLRLPRPTYPPVVDTKIGRHKVPFGVQLSASQTATCGGYLWPRSLARVPKYANLLV